MPPSKSLKRKRVKNMTISELLEGLQTPDMKEQEQKQREEQKQKQRESQERERIIAKLMEGDELPAGKGDRFDPDTGEYETFDVPPITDEDLEAKLRNDKRGAQQRELQFKRHNRKMKRIIYNHQHEANFRDEDFRKKEIVQVDCKGRYMFVPDPHGVVLRMGDSYIDGRGNRYDTYGKDPETGHPLGCWVGTDDEGSDCSSTH